jgi:hypothetical protein
VPYPFNTRQYLRLLVLRGRVHDGWLRGLGLVPRPRQATQPNHQNSFCSPVRHD